MATSQPITKLDSSDDSLFYQQPRLVQHIDFGFIAGLQEVFRRYIPPEGTVLDLMSSWVSHLPDDLRTGTVVGHGMNRVELAANSRLSEYFVQDLNRHPELPLADDRFDAVLNTVSIQYLEDAPAVLREVRRVLKPGGVVIISFSNRMFPTKAVSLWIGASEPERVALVRRYLAEAGGFAQVETHQRTDAGRGWFWHRQDPFYCLTARKVSR
jgi:predicted methyltransferase